MTRAAAVLAAVLLVLTGCGYSDNARREQERYLACIDAGGSYEKDDVDYRCTLP